MKTYFSILTFAFISSLVFSQVEVKPEAGNDGTTLRLFNSNNNYWDINSDYKNIWGHTNTLDFMNKDGNFVLQLFPDRHVNIYNYLLVDISTKLHFDNNGTTGQAKNYDFNENSSLEGIVIEQGR